MGTRREEKHQEALKQIKAMVQVVRDVDWEFGDIELPDSGPHNKVVELYDAVTHLNTVTSSLLQAVQTMLHGEITDMFQDCYEHSH